MFKKVLVAVDGSDASDIAVQWTHEAFQALPQTHFTFLYVHQPYIPLAIGTGYMPVVYEPAEIDLPPEESPAYAAWKGFPDTSRVDYATETGSNPAEVICKKAAEEGYDLIVVGSRGHGLVSSVFLGSVSGKVLHHAKCAVLVVR
ncbi:universal stress protein [Brevibacillus sp. SYP-B805]|uniref:universal stress protein n=1 Tax=Brevibacillus sp. SYP-B805 TaxID=1578199 RepID=UPI0013EC61FA|nr:universal stress protein [Brevibacillus sp. SYP-B805]NGQ93925.1 universal stress protein [Brevibacillus sp. SYP-B805]